MHRYGESAMTPPTACPTYLYPFNEHMPRLTEKRFLCAESLDALRFSGLLGTEAEWTESIRVSLGKSYDPKSDRVITTSSWQEIACWFSCWHTLDLLDRIPQFAP